YKKIIRFYPNPLTSLLDIGCAKGFFVFAASMMSSERNVGIDVHTDDIAVCQWVKTQLNHSAVFEKIHLQQFANTIQHYGGSFQTVLVLNTYQYLYFGSRDYPTHYPDHDFIFQQLQKICHGKIIFNNRLNYAECQSQIKSMNHAPSVCESYSEEVIKAVAKKYFVVREQGELGGYPLWIL